MSTDRAIHPDEGLGDALGRRVEIVDEIPQPAEEESDQDSRRDLPPDLPEVDSEAFQALNRRRVELIKKDIGGRLTEVERDELEGLEKTCGAIVDRAFPLPPVDLEALIRLRDHLRAEKEGSGA